MPKKIRIMYAEDHKLLLDSLTKLLEEVEDFKVIGLALNGVEMLKLIRKNQPDILITDLEMPEMNGFELAKIVKNEFPDIKIMFLSMYFSATFAAEMLANGVNACLPKETGFEILEEAIKDLYKDGYYFKPAMTNYLVSQIMIDKKFLSLRNQLALNEREKEVLTLICEGKTNKEMGELLFLSPATIDFHRQNIYKKNR